MKKIYFLLIALLCSATMSFAYEARIDGIYYDFDHENKTATVTGYHNNGNYNCYSGDVVVPGYVSYNGEKYIIISIDSYAFYKCENLTTIIIPNSVTSIGGNAFSDCISLTSVEIPSGVTEIGARAFMNCSGLTSVAISNNVTKIKYEAFWECTSLQMFTIPSSVRIIEDGAFGHCSSITSIIIPNSVIEIGNYVFRGCTRLSQINVEEDNQNYASIDGVLYDKNITTLMCCPQGKVLVTIPNSVTSIGDYAFSSCSSLVSITIPESVTSIGDGAFEYCLGFTSIEIPHSVTEIGSGAFYGCVGFTSVIIGNGVTLIDDEVFRECVELTSVIIGSGVTSIGSYTFGECVGLTSIEIEAQNPPVIDDDTFEEVSRSIQIKVPCGSKAKYQIAEYWKEFVNYEEVPGATLIVDVNDKTMGFATITKPNSCTDDVAQVQAQALAGYEFVRWSDGATENPHILLVTEDMTITAEFRVVGTGLENSVISSANVYGGNGTLYVEGAEADYHVLDAAGRLVYSGRDAQLQLPRGVYVIAVGGEVEKVVL